MKLRIWIFLGATLLALQPTLATAEKSKQQPSGSAIILPVEFESFLLTAGGSRELNPEWTATGTAMLQDAVDQLAGERYEIVDMPALTDQDRAILAEHRALHDVAVLNAISMIKNAGLKHKASNFDYSIGPGLSFLKARTGAEKLVIYSGTQEKFSGGRKAMMFLGVVAGAATGVGVIPTLGGSSAILSEVDLATGNITWVNYMAPTSKGDVREEIPAKNTIYYLYDDYPGGRLMKAELPASK